MEEVLGLNCPSCNGITRKPVDWLHHNTECRCEHCGLLITIAMSKEWSESKREWNALHHDGSPPRRRLP